MGLTKRKFMNIRHLCSIYVVEFHHKLNGIILVVLVWHPRAYSDITIQTFTLRVKCHIRAHNKSKPQPCLCQKCAFLRQIVRLTLYGDKLSDWPYMVTKCLTIWQSLSGQTYFDMKLVFRDKAEGWLLWGKLIKY